MTADLSVLLKSDKFEDLADAQLSHVR